MKTPICQRDIDESMIDQDKKFKVIVEIWGNRYLIVLLFIEIMSITNCLSFIKHIILSSVDVSFFHQYVWK